jgi:hypothetical protein
MSAMGAADSRAPVCDGISYRESVGGRRIDDASCQKAGLGRNTQIGSPVRTQPRLHRCHSPSWLSWIWEPVRTPPVTLSRTWDQSISSISVAGTGPQSHPEQQDTGYQS